MASDSADRAVPIARQARALLGNKLSNTRGKTKRRVITSRQNGRDTIEQLGMVIWDSVDEYAGQIRGKLENGLGVYKIYSATLDFDPNAVNTYEGDMSAGHFGPSGVYTFANSTLFAGEWVDDRPKMGAETFLHGRFPYEFYFGNLGTDLRDGFQHWLPHGYGVGVNLKRKKAICDRFSYGSPVSGRDNELVLYPTTKTRKVKPE